MRDLINVILGAQSLRPAARTATANGLGVDLKGFHSAVVLIDVGVWTDGTHTFELQESDDDVTYTAVADEDLDGAEPVVSSAATDEILLGIGYLGSKRFLRVKTTVAGATTGAVYGASILRGHPADAPTD